MLGFAKKADFSQGPFRWLTVASPEEPDGTELQLALNNNPAANAYQQALFQKGQPAAMFYTDDIKGDYERIKEGRIFFGDFDPFGDFDLLFGAASQNLKILDLPVRYRERTYGETNIRRFRDGWLLLRMAAFAAGRIKLV